MSRMLEKRCLASVVTVALGFIVAPEPCAAGLTTIYTLLFLRSFEDATLTAHVDEAIEHSKKEIAESNIKFTYMD